MIGSFKIESQDTAGGALLVDLSPWLVSDYGQAGEQLRAVHARKPVGLDRERSTVARASGFPRNVEIDVALTCTAAEAPPVNTAGVSDWRSIPSEVRYSLVALPDEPMRPRLGDPRVGHFLDAGLARLELSELSELSAPIDAALGSPVLVDRDTRTHLLESRARIDHALEASLRHAP